MSTESELQAILAGLQSSCAELRGAAIATVEGLMISACGDLATDIAPATASFLLDSLDQHLSLIAESRTTETMIWTENGVWYLARLNGGRHVLILRADPMTYPAQLRYLAEAIRETMQTTLMAM